MSCRRVNTRFAYTVPTSAIVYVNLAYFSIVVSRSSSSRMYYCMHNARCDAYQLRSRVVALGHFAQRIDLTVAHSHFPIIAPDLTLPIECVRNLDSSARRQRARDRRQFADVGVAMCEHALRYVVDQRADERRCVGRLQRDQTRATS
jgi:hypothetical protein